MQKSFLHLFISLLLIFGSTDSFATALIGGTGHARGVLTNIVVSRDLAQSLLPKGWSLAPIQGLRSDQHILTLFIGNHTNLSSLIAGQRFPVTAFYNEVVYTVTNVKVPGAKKLFVHASALRLDEWKAIAMGVAMGLPKKFSYFEAGANDVTELKNRRGELLMRYRETQVEHYDRIKFENNFKLFNSRIGELAVKIAGVTRCIDFNWNFDLEKLSPVKMVVSLDKRFGRVVPGKFVSDSMDKTAEGAFRVDTNWTMSLPKKCE